MATERFCEKCGAALADGVRFCESCGQAAPKERPRLGLGTDKEPEPKNVYVWIWVLFIPVVNLIAIWFAPLRRFHKGVMLGVVIGVVTGIWVPRFEAIGVPYIIGTFGMVYYCAALILGKAPSGSAGKGSFLTGLPVGLAVAAVIAGGLYAWMGPEEEDPVRPAPSEADIKSLMEDLPEDPVRAPREAPAPAPKKLDSPLLSE